MLTTFSDYCGAAFVPFIDQIGQILLKQLEHRHYDVRTASTLALPGLCKSLKKAES
jgi:hypothetical protein